MSLPFLEVFNTPYEKWSQRVPTSDEMLAFAAEHGRFPVSLPDKLLEKITNCDEAANYIARVKSDNSLSEHINAALNQNNQFKLWQNKMPKQTPSALSRYQKDYENHNPNLVDIEINTIGETLSIGQTLFHGGIWPCPGKNTYRTTRPLSTSFCPDIAFNNARWHSKAYNAGAIHLWVLRVANPKTNVFSYRRLGTSLGHENEVLFATGADLTLLNYQKICDDFYEERPELPNKKIEIYIYNIEIS